MKLMVNIYDMFNTKLTTPINNNKKTKYLTYIGNTIDKHCILEINVITNRDERVSQLNKISCYLFGS